MEIAEALVGRRPIRRRTHRRCVRVVKGQLMDQFSAREADLGVLGTGRMGSRIAAMFARAGRRVVLGSRDSDRAAAIVEKLGIPTLRAGCNSDALAARAILPAVFIRDGLFDLLDRKCPSLTGKL